MLSRPALSRKMQDLLRLKTEPVGIRYLTKITDVPDDFEMIDRTCAVCQVIGKARFHEKGVASTKDWATGCGMGGCCVWI